jgi:hypothetical protein
MNPWYSLLADAVVVLHALYALTVVGGEVLVVLGGLRGWRWVHNFTWRLVHLAMIAVVVLESLVAMACPLTDLEDWLRRQAGQTVEQGTFIGRWSHGLLYVDLPGWAFTLLYCLFGLLVLATLYWVPPRMPGKARARFRYREGTKPPGRARG